MLEQLLQLDRTLTLMLNGSHQLWLDGFAMAVTSTWTWIPALLVFCYVVIRHGEMKDILLTLLTVGLCVLLADQIASGIFKPLVARPRPAGDPLLMLDVDVVEGYRGGRYGFFSSHAANTFAVTTFVSLLVRYRPLSLTLICWALLNCWSRVYLGVHYVGDILCGILCGILVGAFLYWAYRKVTGVQRGAPYGASDVQTASAYAVNDVRVLMGTFWVLFIFCNVKALFF
jgi:undecaprenyl-diphosphatase